MSELSDQRVRRWFKKSASEQYLYAKALTPAQRGDLERALEAQFRERDNPDAETALTMWLSLQQARLRTHRDSDHAKSGLGMMRVLMPGNRKEYFRSTARPEYEVAFDNFMRIIGEPLVDGKLRMAAAQRFVYHARSELTLDKRLTEYLGQNKERVRMPVAISSDERFPSDVASAFALADDWSREFKRHKLAREAKPLGTELNRWLREAGKPALPNANTFDEEENAAVFSRMLERRMRPASLEDRTVTSRHSLVEDGSMVINEIAKHPELRATVFGMAAEALNRCQDAIAEYWSEIVRVVRNHQMEEGVRQGRIGADDLNAFGQRQFRLDALERTVARFINERAIHHETVEVMLHAKVALKKELDLEDSVSQGMIFTKLCSEDIDAIRTKVLEQIADLKNLEEFLLRNEPWCAGMKQLHAADFAALENRFENHWFHDLSLPGQGDECVEEQLAYVEAARDFEREKAEAERRLLLRCAGLGQKTLEELMREDAA